MNTILNINNSDDINTNRVDNDINIKNIFNYAIQIHENLGYGYKEHIYVSALNIHLYENNYLFNNEVIIPIIYKNFQLGFERADTIIYKPNNLIIEFKAQSNKLSSKEINQLRKYIKNFGNKNFNKGILFNFNNKLECIIVDEENHYNLHSSDINAAL